MRCKLTLLSQHNHTQAIVPLASIASWLVCRLTCPSGIANGVLITPISNVTQYYLRFASSMFAYSFLI